MLHTVIAVDLVEQQAESLRAYLREVLFDE